MTTTNEQAANKAWDILVRLACDKEAITYSDLAKKIGVTPQGTTAPLALIYEHCENEKSVINGKPLPPLTVLVVSASDFRCKKTGCQEKTRRKGHPSIGYSEVRKSIPEDSYAVYMHDWAKEPKPNF